MSQRVVVFLDEKNLYKGARKAFFEDTGHFTLGNFHPLQLAELLTSRAPPSGSTDRALNHVRLYTGSPIRSHDPKGHAAHTNQRLAWENAGVTVVARKLRYPRPDEGSQKPQQKGVDVALAVDVVTMFIEDDYDIAVVASNDTDLRPALEYVIGKSSESRIEVASWRTEKQKAQLSVPGRRVWCHRLSHDDYKAVADYTDYRQP